MLVDKPSLIDLGMLPNGAGEWPLGHLLDHTHSRPALDELKALLADPLVDPDDIRARQRLLQQLPQAMAHVSWKPIVALTKNVASYLDSNYIIAPTDRAELALFALRYRDIVTYLEARLLALSQLLELTSAVRDSLKALAGDPAFQAVYAALDAAIASPLRMTLRDAASASAARRMRLARLDQPVRRATHEALRAMLRARSTLDAFHSLATAARQIGSTYPAVNSDAAGDLQFDGLKHPLLPDGAANDLMLSSQERVVFVTGPNMAGKSTLLRAIGIAVHSAYVGLPVRATRASVPRVDRLISSLRVEDSIARGESLYLAEVRRVKAVVHAVASGETVVALLDEVFRGTNAKDAIDATALLVDGLSRAPTGQFFVASHLVEVAESRGPEPSIGLWCMEVNETAVNHEFTYRLTRGVSAVRLGMRLLETEGVVGLLRAIGDRH